MKSICGAVTMLASERAIDFEIIDKISGNTFLRFSMTPKQFAAAMGRRAQVCVSDMEMCRIEDIGKVYDCQEVSIPIPEFEYKEKKAKAQEIIRNYCEKNFPGWYVDDHLGSQGSFTHQGKQEFTNFRVYRYVDNPEVVAKRTHEHTESIKWMEKQS